MSRLKVGVLGATGMVGQRFIQLLEGHPWFDVVFLGASERSAGKDYEKAVEGRWKISVVIPGYVKEMQVNDCIPDDSCDLVFSGLDAAVAGPIEEAYAKSGAVVCSNARNFRYEPDVPILIPEVNSDHLKILEIQKKQHGWQGCIVTNPNCTLQSFTIPFKPLLDEFGIKEAVVVSMQAISGAGYPGVPSLDITDNVIPYIGGEEEKVEKEPLKILGEFRNNEIIDAGIKISAHCNRVHVIDGHTVCVSIKFGRKGSIEDIKDVLRSFRSKPQELKLPSAPEVPITVYDDDFRPQPKMDRNLYKGMGIAVGRIRPCNIFDYRFVCTSHNTIRGAAGGSILNAELMYKLGYIK